MPLEGSEDVCFFDIPSPRLANILPILGSSEEKGNVPASAARHETCGSGTMLSRDREVKL